MRLHGASDFYEVTTDGVGVVSKSIGSPIPKVNAVSADGMNGIIDFTDAMGVYYNNRTISVTIQATNMEDITGLTSPFLDNFVRNYHGKVVDLSFEDTVTRYYTGRLSVTADDHKDRYRTITFAVDADPFRYPLNDTTVSIPVNTGTNFAAGGQIDSPVIGGHQTINTNESYGFRVRFLGYFENYTPYGNVKITGLTVGEKYVLQYKSDGGFITVSAYASRETPQFQVDSNGVFTATASTLYLVMQSRANREARFYNVSVSQPTKVSIYGGDMVVSPTFDALSADVALNVNGTFVQLHKGETWNPYFVIKPGENVVYGIGLTSPLAISYAEAVF